MGGGKFKLSLWRISLEDWGKVCVCVYICVCVCVYVYMLCLVTQLCPTLCNPMDCSPPGSSVHGGFSRQEYWSGLPCPPGDLPNPGMELGSYALQVDSLPAELSGKPKCVCVCVCVCVIHLFIEYNWLSVSFTCTAKWFSTLLLSPSHCIYTHSYIYIKSITYNRFYIYVHILFIRVFSFIDYYKMLGIVACAISRFLLVICFIYVVVQSPSCVRLFATHWTSACQASLSLVISQSLPKFMSVESVMPSNHPLSPFSPPTSSRVFSSESAVHIRWPKY